MRSCLRFGLLVVALVAGKRASAHRHYVSLAEVEIDRDDGAIEVALRIDDHNLEDALRLQRSVDYTLTIDAEGARDAQEYLRDHFVVTADGVALELQWVGWEWSPGMAWLYFEYALPKGTALVELRNTIFLALSERQLNTVNVRVGDERRTLTFERGQPRQRLYGRARE